MKVYLVCDDDEDVAAHVAAPNAGKARYIMLIKKREVFMDAGFTDFRVRRAPERDTDDGFVGILPGQDMTP
jgi:hypothetical protein